MKPIFHHYDVWRELFGDVPPKHARKEYVRAKTYWTPASDTPEIFWPCQSFGIWGLPTKDELPQWIANQLSSKEEYTVKIGVGVASPLDPFSRRDGIKWVEKSSIPIKMTLRSFGRFGNFTRLVLTLGYQYKLTVKYLDKHSFPIIEGAPLFTSNKAFSVVRPEGGYKS